MVKEIRTEIDINAPPERVWSLLTDFAAFPTWNPFIRKATGEPKVGTRLDVSLGASGTKPMGFKPRVLNADANRELRWLGRLAIPGLFSGEHIFTIEPAGPSRVRFVQREIFKGLLVPLMARSLDTNARRGFEEMNQALKEKAETPP
jgi:hypothetical protein